MPKFTVTDAVGTTGCSREWTRCSMPSSAGSLAATTSSMTLVNAWIALKDHPAVQAGWRARQRFRPLEDRNSLAGVAANDLDFPRLADDGSTPRHGIAADVDFEERRAAWRAIRDAAPAPAPNPDLYLSGERALTRSAVLGAVMLLALLCGALVLIARSMAAITR